MKQPGIKSKTMTVNFKGYDLSKSSQFGNMTGSGACEKPIVTPNPTITLNNAQSFSYSGHTYVINLDRIGPAGKNPFKPAAYITFIKYRTD